MPTKLTPEINQPSRYALNIYTDGAYFKNNGSGGWSFVAFCNNQEKHRDYGYKKTHSSLEMELLAAIQAIKSIPQVIDDFTDYAVTVHTDSKIILEGLFDKFCTWEKRNWKVKSGKTVIFKELWQELYQLTQFYNVQWQWVKGHNGTVGNEIADHLARQAALQQNSQTY